MGLELGYIRLDLASHVLRAAPEGEHVVAVREARHGPTLYPLPCGCGSASAAYPRERLPSNPGGAASAATGGRRICDSTANGL